MERNSMEFRERNMPEKGGFKTDERQKQVCQGMLNKLRRNWNWSSLRPEKGNLGDGERKETA